jgi:hypothetical protein
MARWFDDAITEKLREAGNHVILVPARNPNAPIDTVDVFDGVTGKFIAADVPEGDARNFAIVWNNLVDSGENNETFKQVNLSWLIGTKERHYHR